MKQHINLWHWWDGIMWGAHLCQHFIKPMKWSIKMDFDPAGGACDILSVVLGAPALHKAQSYRAHLGQLEYGLVATWDGLSKQMCKVLIVEDAETAARRDLTDGRRMKAVILVAVPTLNENTRVTQALGIHLTTNIVQMQPCNSTNTT